MCRRSTIALTAFCSHSAKSYPLWQPCIQQAAMALNVMLHLACLCINQDEASMAEWISHHAFAGHGHLVVHCGAQLQVFNLSQLSAPIAIVVTPDVGLLSLSERCAVRKGIWPRQQASSSCHALLLDSFTLDWQLVRQCCPHPADCRAMLSAASHFMSACSTYTVD